MRLLASNISLSCRDFFLVYFIFWNMAEKMETACSWYFCLLCTNAVVDHSRDCYFESFSGMDLFLFQRDMADTWIIFMVHTSQYFYDKGNPQKGLLWSGLFPLRDIDNYFFLRFYILLGFDKKYSLTSSNQTKTEKSGVICLKCTIFGNVSKNDFLFHLKIRSLFLSSAD